MPKKKTTVTRVKATAEDPAAVTAALREMASLFYEKQGHTPFLNVAGEGTWEDPYIVQGVTVDGENVPRTTLIVRGDMGEWKETQLPVGSDGLARFRLGRSQGNVHRDMIFSVVR